MDLFSGICLLCDSNNLAVLLLRAGTSTMNYPGYLSSQIIWGTERWKVYFKPPIPQKKKS